MMAVEHCRFCHGGHEVEHGAFEVGTFGTVRTATCPTAREGFVYLMSPSTCERCTPSSKGKGY